MVDKIPTVASIIKLPLNGRDIECITLSDGCRIFGEYDLKYIIEQIKSLPKETDEIETLLLWARGDRMN